MEFTAKAIADFLKGEVENQNYFKNDTGEKLDKYIEKIKQI